MTFGEPGQAGVANCLIVTAQIILFGASHACPRKTARPVAPRKPDEKQGRQADHRPSGSQYPLQRFLVDRRIDTHLGAAAQLNLDRSTTLPLRLNRHRRSAHRRPEHRQRFLPAPVVNYAPAHAVLSRHFRRRGSRLPAVFRMVRFSSRLKRWRRLIVRSETGNARLSRTGVTPVASALSIRSVGDTLRRRQGGHHRRRTPLAGLTRDLPQQVVLGLKSGRSLSYDHQACALDPAGVCSETYQVSRTPRLSV